MGSALPPGNRLFTRPQRRVRLRDRVAVLEMALLLPEGLVSPAESVAAMMGMVIALLEGALVLLEGPVVLLEWLVAPPERVVALTGSASAMPWAPGTCSHVPLKSRKRRTWDDLANRHDSIVPGGMQQCSSLPPTHPHALKKFLPWRSETKALFPHAGARVIRPKPLREDEVFDFVPSLAGRSIRFCPVPGRTER